MQGVGEGGMRISAPFTLEDLLQESCRELLQVIEAAGALGVEIKPTPIAFTVAASCTEY